MRMPELKSLARDRRLRNYSWMRKAELVALLQNSPPPGQSHTSTSPTPPTQTWEPKMIGVRGNLVHKKWIYLNNRRSVKVDHKSKANLINGTIG